MIKRILAILLLGWFNSFVLPAEAASFDGQWSAEIAPVPGCAGGDASTITLTVTGGTLAGTLRNVGASMPITGTLDTDGGGSVTIARIAGTVKFGGDHFTMDWRGTQGCARHAEGTRAPAPAPIFANAPNQAVESVALFMAFCLQVYPDENALADIMSQQGGAPLSVAEFNRLLPIDGKTGRGWTIKGSKGSYVLLVSQGLEPSMAALMPNMKVRACTLVTNGPTGMDPLPAFRSVKQQHAERKGIPLLPPITNYKLPNDGAMEAQQLGPSSGIFMYSEVVKPETAPLKEFRMEFRPPG